MVEYFLKQNVPEPVLFKNKTSLRVCWQYIAFEFILDVSEQN